MYEVAIGICGTRYMIVTIENQWNKMEDLGNRIGETR